MKIPIKDIKVAAGRREARLGEIRKLADSIAEVGLLNPVTVDREHTLIAGRHRLEAAKLLGWTEIECTVSDLEGVAAELAEIDENFARTNASTIEIGEMLKRRKRLYETLHPETKAGVAQANGMNRALGNNVDCTVQSKSFVKDTAEKWGVDPSTVSRHLQIAEELTPEAKDILCGMKRLPRQTTLRQLSTLEPDAQADAARLLAAGRVKTVGEYLALRGKAGQERNEADKEGKKEKGIGAQKRENANAADKTLPEIAGEQAEAAMMMACITEDFVDGIRVVMDHKDGILTLPRVWAHYLTEMIDAIENAKEAVFQVILEAYLNNGEEGARH